MKTYSVYTIPSEEAISQCPLFYVDTVLWNSRQAPRTVGRLGYIPGRGLYFWMQCDETNPKRSLTGHMDRVCTDSALEAFFAFPEIPDGADELFAPDNNALYFNFEINANGAMYAKTGWGRKGREPLLPEEFAQTEVCAQILADGWEVSCLVPAALICRLTGIESFAPGDSLFCNFYKISEDPAIEHYLSYNPIESETPNFHLPRYFAKAVVCGEENKEPTV